MYKLLRIWQYVAENVDWSILIGNTIYPKENDLHVLWAEMR